MGVRELFVRTGTFKRDGDGARLTLPQEWRSNANGLPVHLVFNFGYDLVRGFKSISTDRLSQYVVGAIRAESKRAELAGINVAGIQLDFDVPTGHLARYADFLRQVRRQIPVSDTLHKSSSPRAFSITALTTWLRSPAYRNVCEAVDFTTPQFYEAEVPATLDRLAPISNLTRFDRGLEDADRLGFPFYAGVPAYGHALVFDPRGKLLGLFHDMAARQAARSGIFRFDKSWGSDARGTPATSASYSGEDMVQFSTQETTGDRGIGARLIYDLPTPDLVARHLTLLRSHRLSNCRGVILFRYPERYESQTLPLTSLAAALQGRPAAPKLDLKIETASVPWDLIETGRTARRSI
jgi:hypothetical protein